MRSDRQREVELGFRAAADALGEGRVHDAWELATGAFDALDNALSHTVSFTADTEAMDVAWALRALRLIEFFGEGEAERVLADAMREPQMVGTYGNRDEATSYATTLSIVSGLTAVPSLKP